MKIHLYIIQIISVWLFVCLATLGFATTYTWNGVTSTNYAASTNWTPNGVPGNTDSITIVTGSNNVLLDQNRTIGRFTMTSGTFNLNGFEFTINDQSTYTAGTISNGTIKPRGAPA